MVLAVVLTVFAGYLLGNLNGAVSMSNLLGHEDIRDTGSGNAGLTNFMRRYGPASGLAVIAIDVAKSVLSCLLGMCLLRPFGYAKEGMMIGAVAVSLGHDFPALLGFRGGKGILSGLAIALTVDYRCGLIILAIFAVSLAVTRYVSLSSILGALGFSVSFAVFYWNKPFVAVCGVLLGLLAVFMHRSNIGRLIKGTEKKATFSQFRRKKNK